MDRNLFYILTGALAVIVIALGVQVSHERGSTPGITLALKDSSVGIREKN